MALRKAPYRYQPQKTRHIMRWLQVVLVLHLGVSVAVAELGGYDGLRGLISAAIALVVGLAVEVGFYISWNRFESLSKLINEKHPFITPLLVVLLLPLHTPFYIIGISTLVAVWIGKLVFGGFGFSIFNNAVVGVLFAYVSFANDLAFPLINAPGYNYPIELLKVATFANSTVGFDLQSLFLGGNYYMVSLGAMSGLAVVISFLVLSFIRVIDWRISVAFVAAVYGMSFIAGGQTLAMEMILSGLVLVGAVFFVSDPVTSPTTRNTKLLYAVVVALITVMIRILGDATEGVLFAVLIGNVITPFMNRSARKSSFVSFVQMLLIAAVITATSGYVIQLAMQPETLEVASLEVLDETL
jgi:electron transport complex protein RnfD